MTRDSLVDDLINAQMMCTTLKTTRDALAAELQASGLLVVQSNLSLVAALEVLERNLGLASPNQDRVTDPISVRINSLARLVEKRL